MKEKCIIRNFANDCDTINIKIGNFTIVIYKDASEDVNVEVTTVEGFYQLEILGKESTTEES